MTEFHKPAFDLIIFDCDGVLVDSERVANQVFAGLLAEVCDLHLSLEQMFEIFVGHSRAQCMQKIEAMIGKPPPDELERRYQTDIDSALASSVNPIAGIEALLANLKLPFCVASSGSHEKMQMTLGKTGLLPYVEHKLFSASEVNKAKPAPDIFLHAANRMGGFEANRCLVIEDSPVGGRHDGLRLC